MGFIRSLEDADFTGVCQNVLVSAEIGRIKIFLFGDLHAFLHTVKMCVLL
jgi:hypothetical protein